MTVPLVAHSSSLTAPAMLDAADLMTEPTAFEAIQKPPVPVTDETVVVNTRFTTGPSRDYVRQYANLYWFRLEKLKPVALDAARRKWFSIDPAPLFVDKLLDVEPGVLSVITGTVYLEMPLKPNVLDELAENQAITPQPIANKYCSEKDEIMLEDHSGRIQLTGDFLKSELLVTGIVVTVLGQEVPGGSFEVKDLCYPGYAPQKPLTPLNDDRYLLLMSGLDIDPSAASVPFLEAFVEFVAMSKENCLNITNIIMAGNLLHKHKFIDIEGNREVGSLSDTISIQHLDQTLALLTKFVPVDIMPGNQDPTAVVLPQQPLHRAMFPISSQTDLFRSHTNPHCFSVNNIHFLGTSGQNIDDLSKYFENVDTLELSEQTLKWRHIAPTAPDTLSCFPYNDQDPFIIDSMPHVYFVGNQPNFQVKSILDDAGRKISTIIHIPRFSDKGEVVLVNLKSLDASSLVMNIT